MNNVGPYSTTAMESPGMTSGLSQPLYYEASDKNMFILPTPLDPGPRRLLLYDQWPYTESIVSRTIDRPIDLHPIGGQTEVTKTFSVWRCDACPPDHPDVKFLSFGLLQKHVHLVHATSGQLAKASDKCHQQQYLACQFCSRNKFATKNLLLAHLRRCHAGETVDRSHFESLSECRYAASVRSSEPSGWLASHHGHASNAPEIAVALIDDKWPYSKAVESRIIGRLLDPGPNDQDSDVRWAISTWTCLTCPVDRADWSKFLSFPLLKKHINVAHGADLPLAPDLLANRVDGGPELATGHEFTCGQCPDGGTKFRTKAMLRAHVRAVHLTTSVVMDSDVDCDPCDENDFDDDLESPAVDDESDDEDDASPVFETPAYTFAYNHSNGDLRLDLANATELEMSNYKLMSADRANGTDSAVANQCLQCQPAVLFSTAVELMRHVRKVHERKTDNSLCGPQKRKRKKDGEEIKCDQCGKEYQQQAALTAHIRRVHLAIRDNRCHMCPHACYTRSDLKSHIRRMHTSDSDASRPKRHICSICGEAFEGDYKLRRHTKLEHGSFDSVKSAVRCHICDSPFRTPRCLARHVADVHRGRDKDGPPVGRFPCQICGHSFTRRSNMLSHVELVHTANASEVCQICNLAFTRKSSLKRHLAVVHAAANNVDQAGGGVPGVPSA